MKMATGAARIKRASVAALLVAQPAEAHVAELGIVLLLPTDVYIAAGVATVAATVVLLALLPPGAAAAVFRPRLACPVPRLKAAHFTSGAVALALAALIWAGLYGPRDPLANPLPLAIWTVWWIGLVAVQGVLGDIWRWANPWTGPAALVEIGRAHV